MTEDPVTYDAKSKGLCTRDMTVGFSDVEFIKINALRLDLKLSWAELLNKIRIAFSDENLQGNDIDKINSIKCELNLSSSELLKKVCLMELMIITKRE